MEMSKRAKEILQKIFDREKVDILEYKRDCHDCGKPVHIVIDKEPDGYTTIVGGAIYWPKDWDGAWFLKCEACHEIDKDLRNYQECEVFSRVVGYLRPVKQWNVGKQAERDARVDFNMSGWKKEE